MSVLIRRRRCFFIQSPSRQNILENRCSHRNKKEADFKIKHSKKGQMFSGICYNKNLVEGVQAGFVPIGPEIDIEYEAAVISVRTKSPCSYVKNAVPLIEAVKPYNRRKKQYAGIY